ncbi:hypothetical protein CVT25_006932 [Psilocybe cyanescens]|uniref:Uncharacterized protein n=1 Tax=Psilocybe cyanescens TaxID=93625 RepID=A0A409X5Y5_PSICY|nr:hypothetical protein CVT25_006932 [Psilocybe cyanescens]
MSSLPNLPVFDANNTLGALLIGLFVSCCLFGISGVQLYIYYGRFKDDRTFLKALVAVVWLLELAHCICICHAFYAFSVIGYGNPLVLSKFPLSMDIAVLISGFIGAMVQGFFINRIRIVSGKIFIPALAWSLALCRCGLTIATFIKGTQMTSLPMFLIQWRWLLVTTLSVGTALDFVILLSLSYYLRSIRTSFIVDKITMWTIPPKHLFPDFTKETGTVTGLIGLLVIVVVSILLIYTPMTFHNIGCSRLLLIFSLQQVRTTVRQ